LWGCLVIPHLHYCPTRRSSDLGSVLPVIVSCAHHRQFCPSSEDCSCDWSSDEDPSSEDSSSEESSSPDSSSFFSLAFFSLALVAASFSSSNVVGSLALSSSLTMRSYFPGAKSSSVRLQFLST